MDCGGTTTWMRPGFGMGLGSEALLILHGQVINNPSAAIINCNYPVLGDQKHRQGDNGCHDSDPGLKRGATGWSLLGSEAQSIAIIGFEANRRPT